MQLLKRVAVTLLGGGLLLLGLAMMVLPGPGVLVVVAGLAVLATEYAWAQRVLRRARSRAGGIQEAAVASPARTGATVLFGLGLLALGTAMVVERDVDLPAWGPVPGVVLAVTALVLLTTTCLACRAARGHGTTATGRRSGTSGSRRAEQGH